MEGQFNAKWVDSTFKPFIALLLVSLFTMKHLMEVDNEVIFLSNNWIWY